jgi:tetratricopeptide (TPR) repeat protein
MEAPNTSTTLVTTNASVVTTTGASLPPVAWRDPHTVPPEELSAYIKTLEAACLAEPRSANLRTCLGMAYAVNYEVDKSMDALEAAIGLDPTNFWAQLKYSELHYRLRALNKAEEGTRKALNLANDAWQLSIARQQLQKIRTLKQSCVRNVEWTKSLGPPAFAFAGMLLFIFVAMMWK